MADKTIVTESGTWRINTTVGNILGKGACGIVCRASDSKSSKIAAKRIDTHDKHKLAKITADLEKLKELDHPNISKIV